MIASLILSLLAIISGLLTAIWGIIRKTKAAAPSSEFEASDAFIGLFVLMLGAISFVEILRQHWFR